MRVFLGEYFDILLVPPTRKLSAKKGLTHYQAFFFGLGEKQLQRLRVVINYYFNNKFKEINEDFLLVAQKQKKKNFGDLEDDELENEEGQEEQEEEKENIVEDYSLVSVDLEKYKKNYTSKM